MSKSRKATALGRALGARIRTLREERALTQENLAWECDLDKGYLSQLEAGKRLPSVTTMAMIAKRLEIEIVDLLVLDERNARMRLLDAARRKDTDAVRKAIAELGLDTDR